MDSGGGRVYQALAADPGRGCRWCSRSSATPYGDSV